MWQFAQAVEGIGAACRALDVPITGGNVSLYNETDGKAIYPTPVIGVVGLLEHADRVVEPVRNPATSSFYSERAGASSVAANTSRSMIWFRSAAGPRSRARARLQELVVALAEEQLIRSAHDCSDGGLAVTLAECCFDTRGSAPKHPSTPVI